jgi:hypothetical protein
MFQSFSKSRAGNPLQHRISSARPLGFNKASEAAAQFGASRVFIVLRWQGLRRCFQFRQVALRPHQSAYRLCAALRLNGLAARCQPSQSLIHQPPQSSGSFARQRPPPHQRFISTVPGL